jgi:hypothetical protein
MNFSQGFTTPTLLHTSTSAAMNFSQVHPGLKSEVAVTLKIIAISRILLTIITIQQAAQSAEQAAFFLATA